VPQPADTRWIQAEWAASIKTQITDDYAFLLSGSTGLPLSSGTVDFGNGHEQREHFLGLGVPEWRALVSFVVASVPEH